MKNLYEPYYGRKEWHKVVGPVTVGFSWPARWARPTTLREIARDASLCLYVISYWLTCVTVGILAS